MTAKIEMDKYAERLVKFALENDMDLTNVDEIAKGLYIRELKFYNSFMQNFDLNITNIQHSLDKR